MSYRMSDDSIKVINSEVEGDQQITKLEPILFCPKKYYFQIVVSILTGGIWALFLYWSPKILKDCIFNQAELHNCSHFYVRLKQKQFMIVKKNEIKQTYFQEEETSSFYFDVMFLRYLFNPLSSSFEPIEFLKQNSCSLQDIKKTYMTPQYQEDSNLLKNMQNLFGSCQITIPIPNFLDYLIVELIKPFMFVSYMGIVIWWIEGFYSTSIALIVSIGFFIVLNFFFVKHSFKKLQDLARMKEYVNTFRHTRAGLYECKQINIDEVVPGDLIEISRETDIPADCLLLQGELVMEEGMLTGEVLFLLQCIPVNKVAISSEDQLFSFQNCQRHVLFQGTNILRVLEKQESQLDPVFQKKAIALVLRSSFSTLKGQLIRNMIFPSENNEDFFSSIMKFVTIYGAFIQASSLFVYIYMILNFPDKLIILRFFDVFLYIYPPTLQIVFSFFQTMSLIRLRKLGIYGIYPDKIYSAGKVQTCCFDKTGTLTQTGIHFHCVLESTQNSFKLLDQENLESSPLVKKLMATCHGILLEKDEQIGDILDIQMQKNSGWQLEVDPEDINKNIYKKQDQQMKTLQLFDFESHFQRMSVIVQEANQHYIFIKGSPEKLATLCGNLPENFQKVQDEYSMKGFRVLAMAYRQLDIVSGKQYTRAEVEKDLTFLGLLVFSNPLKHDSKKVISDLMNADISCRLISGDNINTSIEIGNQVQFYKVSNMLKSDSIVQINDYVDNHFVIKIMKNFQLLEEHKISEESIDKIPNLQNEQINQCEKIYQFFLEFQQKYQYLQMAMTGPFYKQLKVYVKRQQNHIKKMKKIKGVAQVTEEFYFLQLVKECTIFGRMQPSQKQNIIQNLQDAKLKVAMVGDGANDCSAIKLADVGISFHESDASLSAPFSSVSQSIDCVEKVLLEGRCTLMNNIELLRYGYFNSFLRIIQIQVMALFGFFYSDNQFVFAFIGSATLPFAIGLTGPPKHIYKDIPFYNILDRTNTYTMLGSFFFCSLSIVYCMFEVLINDYWENSGLLDNEYQTKGYINTVLYLNFWIIGFGSLFCLYISTPFKKPIYQNKILFVPLIIVQGIAFMMAVFPFDTLQDFLKLVYLDRNFRIRFYFVNLAIFFMNYVFVNNFVLVYIAKIKQNVVTNKIQKC